MFSVSSKEKEDGDNDVHVNQRRQADKYYCSVYQERLASEYKRVVMQLKIW